MTLSNPISATISAMFPDARELERRAEVVAQLPRVLPAAVVISISDEELDALAEATGVAYWRKLNRVVRRIEIEVEGR